MEIWEGDTANPGGYICDRCNLWVQHGTVHMCEVTIPFIPVKSPNERTVEALEQIVKELRKLIKVLKYG